MFSGDIKKRLVRFFIISFYLFYHNNTYKVVANLKLMVDEEKKQEYIKQRDEFKKKKVGLLEQISQHNSEIKKLEKQVEEARPKTANGTMDCTSCDCISMKYVGRTPQGGCSGGDDVYECEICGRSNIDRYYWF